MRHQETRQISAAELETRVGGADPENSGWSGASSKTGPSRGHLFSQTQRHGGEVTLSGSAGDHQASARPHAIWVGSAPRHSIPALGPALPCPPLQRAPGHWGTPGTASQALLFPLGILPGRDQRRDDPLHPAGSGGGPRAPLWPCEAELPQDRAPDPLPLGHSREKTLQDEF